MRPNPHFLIEKPSARIASLLAVWTAFGLFFGTQNYLRDIYGGRNANLVGYLISWIVCGYSWAILTVPVLWFARKFSFNRLKFFYFLPVHIFAGAIFAMAQLGIYLVIASILFEHGSRSVVEFYQFLLASEFQSSLLVYFAIIASVYIYDHFFGDVPIRIGKGDNLTESAVDSLLSNCEKKVSGEKPDESTRLSENGNGTVIRRISVKENGRIVLLDVGEIDWITSEGNYVNLHTKVKKYMVRDTMNAMEKKLDSASFVRIRRSVIVRVDEIREFHPMFNGEYEVVLKSGSRLSSSRRYRKNLDSILRS